MNKSKILIVEDNEDVSFLMQSFLEDCGFIVETAFTITDGISYLKNNEYDMLLLDLELPDYSGFDLLRAIRETIIIPTIVISAYSDLSTKLKAFKYGASDYIVKPLELLELEARIWVWLSRPKNTLQIDKKQKELFKIEENNIIFKNKVLALTSLEFNIFSFFIKNQGQVVLRDDILELSPMIKNHRLIDNHIKNIREKIEDNKSKPKYLKTEYGVGYRLF